MTSHWTGAAAALGCAALLATACGGSDGMNDERRANAGQTPVQTQQLTLVGCVQTGPAETAYVLQNARHAETDATAGTASDGREQSASAITEGSWVQLVAMQESDLRQYVGQQVRVSGSLIDSGESTIGTSGTKGQELPSGDRSQAAADQHHSKRVAEEAGPIARESMANGSAPQMQVASVTATGEPCAAQQHRNR